MWFTFQILLAALMSTATSNDPSKQPEQVHIALGDEVSKMTITWSSFNDTDSVVMYGFSSEDLKQFQKGQSSLFVDGGSENRYQFIHKVELSNLKPKTRYYYIVGSDDGWSSVFSFRSIPDGTNWGPKLIVYGDLGLENAQSLPRLKMEVNSEKYDAILHVGDFAYDFSNDNGTVGDAFMRQMEPVAANIPYMTCPGNHEAEYDFSHYRARFNMPNDNKRMYYSFNMGPVHIVSISTEFIFDPFYEYMSIFKQYEWLKNDLMEASAPENRTLRPWIITFGHRPMYCSNNDTDDCTKHESIVRHGMPEVDVYSMEDLFYETGVDLSIWAHEHSYERLWPLYNATVLNGSYEQPYKNPKGLTHIVTGSAGNSELRDYFSTNVTEFSALKSSDYGYTRIQFVNITHLYVEQVSDDLNGTVIDSFTLIREQHVPYEDLSEKLAITLGEKLTDKVKKPE